MSLEEIKNNLKENLEKEKELADSIEEFIMVKRSEEKFIEMFNHTIKSRENEINELLKENKDASENIKELEDAKGTREYLISLAEARGKEINRLMSEHKEVCNTINELIYIANNIKNKMNINNL